MPKYEKLYRYHIPYGENCQAKSGGFKFNLKAGNGEIIATSQVYKSLPSCKKGIASVQKNAAIATTEDQTVEGYKAEKNPKFEIYQDKKKEYRFRLKAANGQIIATGEGYKELKSCKNVSPASRRMLLPLRSCRNNKERQLRHLKSRRPVPSP